MRECNIKGCRRERHGTPRRTLPDLLLAICDLCSRPANVNTLTWQCRRCDALADAAAQKDREQERMWAARRLVEDADPELLTTLAGAR